MPEVTPQQPPSSLPTHSFRQYYLHDGPSRITAARQTLMWFFLTHFGVRRHLRQLFLPWKRLYVVSTPEYPLSSWHVYTFNFISRILGACVRLGTAITGLTLAGATAVASVGILALWFICLPLDALWYFLVVARSSQVVTTHSKSNVIQTLLADPLFTELTQRAEFTPEQSTQLLEEIETALTVLEPKAIEQLVAASSKREAVLTWLLEVNLTQAELARPTISWMLETQQQRGQTYHWYEKEAWMNTPSIGATWSYGFTPTLDRFTQDVNVLVAEQPQSDARPEELQHLIETFSNSQNTAVLYVGEPGVGKKTLCYSLAQAIVEHHVPATLADHRVLFLNMDAFLAAVPRPAEQQWLLEQMCKEATAAGNCIIVIDNLDRYVSNRWGEPDFSPVLSRVGKEYRLKLIGLATTDGFRQFVTANSLIMSAFSIRHLEPLNAAQTLEVLKSSAYRYESASRILSLPALQEVVALSQQLLDHIPNPERSLTLLDTALSGIPRSAPVVTKTAINQVLSQKAGIPLGDADQATKDKLADLQNALSARVVGQTRALQSVAASVKRAALNLHSKTKPRGTFLFLGPTGVGKTETAKALAAIYFGSEERMIRFDFGEYTAASSLSNLIGASAENSDHSAGGQLTEAIRQNPYTVVLLDELEKAHPTILTALLTLFDEGYLTDARGKKVSFRHAFVIATSNAASQLLYNHYATQQADSATTTEPVESESDYQALHDQVLENLISTGTFAPEFLNRFDGVILFSPLTKADVGIIVDRRLSVIQTQMKQQKHLDIQVTDQKRAELVELSYSPTFGARNLERVLTEQVVDVCAERLLTQSANEHEPLVIG